MNALTVLFDPGCPLCVRCRGWLGTQPQHIPLFFVAQGTAEAHRRFPGLGVGPGQPVNDLIVVDRRGNVYRNARAWIMCFFALKQYRPLAMRLSHPALMPMARRAYQAIANNRLWLSRWFGTADHRISNAELADRIKTHTAPVDDGCHTRGAACGLTPGNKD